jgi:hypothetical protein
MTGESLEEVQPIFCCFVCVDGVIVLVSWTDFIELDDGTDDIFCLSVYFLLLLYSNYNIWNVRSIC